MKTCTVPVLPAPVPSPAQIDALARPCASELFPNGLTGSCGNICGKMLSTLPGLNKVSIVPVPHCHKGLFSIVEVDNLSQSQHHVLPLPSRVAVHLFLAFGSQSKKSPDGITRVR